MPAWCWLLVFGAAVATGLIMWLVMHEPPSEDTVAKKAERAASKERIASLEAQLRAEQEAKAAAEEVSKEMAAKLVEVGAWYARARNALREEHRDEYERLVGNRRLLDDKLDELLSVACPGDKPTG